MHLVRRMKTHYMPVWINEQELYSIIKKLYPKGLKDTVDPPITYVLNILGLL